MIISRYIAFSKIIFDFSFTIFLLFTTLKNKPSRSRRSMSRVKEKCVRGQGEVRWSQGKVRQGWRGSASAEYHTFSGNTSPWPPMHFSLTPDALLLDLEGLFSRVEKSNKQKWKKNPKLLLKTLYILKYSYA